jgi:hypothetical protein
MLVIVVGGGRTGSHLAGLLLAGFAAELALIFAMIYVPPLRALFEEGPLPVKYWLFLMLYPPVMFLAEEARKAFVRRRQAGRAADAGAGDPIRGGTAAATASGGSA